MDILNIIGLACLLMPVAALIIGVIFSVILGLITDYKIKIKNQK